LETIKPIVREKDKLTAQISAIKTDIKSIVNQLFLEMLKNTNIFTKVANSGCFSKLSLKKQFKSALASS